MCFCQIKYRKKSECRHVDPWSEWTYEYGNSAIPEDIHNGICNAKLLKKIVSEIIKRSVYEFECRYE